MKKFATGFMTAAMPLAALWLIARWLTPWQANIALPTRKLVESWENEGGALAPQPGGLETSQVPRLLP